MAIPNASVSVSDRAQKAGESKANTANLEGWSLMGDMNMLREVKSYIYVYNISPQEQRISRPWAHPEYIIPACPEGQLYAMGNKIPDVLQMPIEKVGTSEFSMRGVSGKFLAADMLNPDNITDWKTQKPMLAANANNYGTDLYDCGCFWSESNPPLEEELKISRTRLEARYNRLINEANLLSLSNKIEQITPEMRRAATYLGLEVTWNKIHKASATCPECGEKIPVGAAMDIKGCGAVLNWDKAISLGLKKESDRPKV